MGCGSSTNVAVNGKQLQPKDRTQPTEDSLLHISISSQVDPKGRPNSTSPSDSERRESADKVHTQGISIFSAASHKEKMEEHKVQEKERSKDDSTQETPDKPAKKRVETPKKQELTTEEAIEELMSAMDHLKNAESFLAKPLVADFAVLMRRFATGNRKTASPSINLHGFEHGLVELCWKIWKELFQEDFLDEEENFIFDRLRKVIAVMWNGTDQYTEMCERLLKLGAQEYLLQVIQHPKIVEADETQVRKYSRQIYVIKGVFGIIHNMLVRLGEAARTVFRELNAVTILQKQLESANTMVKAKAFINLAYLINEDENELINADDVHIQFIVGLLQDAVNSETRRSKKGFSAGETVEALNKLAINDNNKERIHDSGALELYERLLVEGVTEDEQITIVHGVWTLAFHKKCRETINGMEQLQSCLKELAKSENVRVKKVAEGAIWVLQDHSEKEANAHDTKDDQHIMISYNWGVKPTALQIRDKLIEAGHKVWMDVDNMTGSTLEAMADAVEKASVVIICMTRKYKESPSCRTEAEYTYQLRKPFIPLRLESGYKADGWLGIMIGTKLWFDFIKNFQGASAGLIKELGNMGSPSSELPMIQAQKASGVGASPKAPLSSQPAFCSWSEAQVSTWLKQNGLSHQASKLLSLDGGLLKELSDMRRDAPEFFYSNLRDDLHFTLIDILKFTKALNKL